MIEIIRGERELIIQYDCPECGRRCSAYENGSIIDTITDECRECGEHVEIELTVSTTGDDR